MTQFSEGFVKQIQQQSWIDSNRIPALIVSAENLNKLYFFQLTE